MENQVMRETGWFQVLDWQLATSNPSSLCLYQNCVFQLEGGIMGTEFTPGERMLTGKLKTEYRRYDENKRSFRLVECSRGTHRGRSNGAGYRRNVDPWY